MIISIRIQKYPAPIHREKEGEFFLNEPSIIELWNNFKQPKIYVIGVPKEGGGKF